MLKEYYRYFRRIYTKCKRSQFVTVDPSDQDTKGMIDVSEKSSIKRVAVAEGKIYLTKESILHVVNKTNPKGDVLENAKLAAIVAIKKTPDLVFLCHPIKIASVRVDFNVEVDFISCTTEVIAIDKTGAEIEAVAGVMNALLAIFDLSKRFEKDVDGQYLSAKITDIRVVHKLKEV